MTQHEIAKLLNISRSTVSLALSGSARVNALTREKILKLAEQVDYRPNMIAKSLSMQRSFSVGVVFPRFSHPFYAQLLDAIFADLKKEKYVGLFHASETEEDQKQAVDNLCSRGVDGIICFMLKKSIMERLTAQKIPVVTYHDNEIANISSVNIDRLSAAVNAVQYLIDLGHREIAYLGFTNDDRYQGYRKSLEKNGICLDESLVIHMHDSLNSAYSAARNLICEGIRFSAAFCFNDLVAIGTMKAAVDCGLQLPRDLSIIGFDNILQGKYMIPALTTVEQPINDISENLVRLLMTQISHKGNALKESVVVDANLIVRESCVPRSS